MDFPSRSFTFTTPTQAEVDAANMRYRVVQYPTDIRELARNQEEYDMLQVEWEKRCREAGVKPR